MTQKWGEKACLEATLSVCKARLLCLEPEPLLPPLGARLSRRNCYFIVFFVGGGVQSCNELGQNSLRNSYSSSTSGPNRGSQEDGRVLCMPSFPVASPVQPADCNLPPGLLGAMSLYNLPEGSPQQKSLL
ncbi:hypothetical protein E2320_006324 [Naja naja]|nr:hypothetical protein E2320_006324 [Naja naja]